MIARVESGRVPGGWRRVRLDAVCEIQLGKMLSPKSKTGWRPRPYLRNTNVQWNRFDLSDVVGMDFSEAEEEKFALRPADLLVCEGGEPGRAAVWQGQIEPCYYQKALHRLRPIDNRVDPYFVMYRLWFGALGGEFTGEHAKTTIAHLPAVRLGSLVIDVPSLAEQKRIVAIVNDQIAAVERARAAAESQLEAAECLAPVYFRKTFDSPDVQRWPLNSLGDVLKLRKEVVHPRDKPRGAALFIGLEHIESGTGVRFDSVDVEMSELTGRKPRFYKGDIVYGYLRPYLNKVWLADLDGLCSVDQYVYEVLPDRATPEFIAAFMRSPIFLERAPITSTPGQLPRIRTDEVASVRINLPPVGVQQEMMTALTAEMDQVGRVCPTLKSQLRKLEALAGVLLRQAFSGQL